MAKVTAFSEEIENAQTYLALNAKSNNATEFIEKINTGCTSVVVSNADFSLWNLVESIIKTKGKAKLYFATWSFSELSARKMCEWLDNGLISECVGILDYRSKNRHEAAYHLAKLAFAKVKTESCHAKVTVLIGENYNISIMGSSNFTENPRIECNVIVDDENLANKHIEWITHVIDKGYDFD